MLGCALGLTPRLAQDRVGSWQVLLCLKNDVQAPYCSLQGQGPAEPLWGSEKSTSTWRLVKGTFLDRCNSAPGHKAQLRFYPPTVLPALVQCSPE